MYRRTTVAGLPALLAAALLAGGCSDLGGPQLQMPRAPAFALDQYNGTLSASGTALVKGFNPTNPHLGSTVVATFFWLGSTNIITAVSDHLSDATFTLVGNTYTLVEYVTAGGISMATYVATNVQNFPDPCCGPTQDKILVVKADLASPVTDGGVLISSYTGVSPVLAQALGAHSSAVGAGSSTTAADPGAITAAAGAHVYAVTVANSVVGVAPPTGFSGLAIMSDAAMKVDGEYLIQGAAASVDPQWTWFFNSSSSWLATVLALNPAVPAATHLVFAVQPSTAFAGRTIAPPVQVLAQDDAGNTVSSFNSTITVALGTNPSGGTLSGTTAVTAVNGVATFANLSIDKVGSGYTLQANATGLTSATSTAFNVTARLAFLVQPTSAIAASAMSPAVQIVAQDDAGNTVSSYNGTITVALGTNPSGGTLSGTTAVTAVNGVATFANLSVDRVASGYTLQATAPGLTSATSAAFNITAILVFTVQPSTTLPLFTIQPAVQVTAVDARGNPIASFTGLVTIAIGQNGGLLLKGTLSGTKTVGAVNGVARFADLSIDQAGNGYTLRATGSLVSGAESAKFNIGL